MAKRGRPIGSKTRNRTVKTGGTSAVKAGQAAPEVFPAGETETEDPIPETARAAPAEFPGLVNEESEPAAKPEQTYYSKKKAAAQAKETATWLLLILNGAAIVAFGEDAKMSDAEREMILEPLQRIMARIDPAVNDALQKWTDPILLLFGVATWGLRLYAIAQDRADDEGPPPKPRAGIPPSNGNGSKETPADDSESVWTRTGPPVEITSQISPGGFE